MTPSLSGEVLRRAVLRVCSSQDSQDLYGTAFGVAENWVLTCAHVVQNRREGELQLDGSEGQFRVVEILRHPDKEGVDLALLQTNRPLRGLLACSASVAPVERLHARGYSRGDVGWGGHDLQLTSRGQTNVRYVGPTETFTISDAFDLAGDMAEPGCSGAPIFDPRTAAIVGVVSAGNPSARRTWAVPLSSAAEWLPLQEALAWNERNLPRFGSAVNLLGAMELCRLQTELEMRGLKRSRKFVPEWDVPRQGLMDLFRSFLDGEWPAMAIVGDANTGKTWFLCHLVESEVTEGSVLLRAAALDCRETKSLESYLGKCLEEAAKGIGGDAVVGIPPASLVATVLGRSGKQLLVLLDGINEVPEFGAFRRDWLPNAIGWCRESGVKLVMTSRGELWPALARSIPDSTMNLFVDLAKGSRESRSPAPEECRVRLGDFSAKEADAARRAYGVTIPVDGGLGHHPLVFRAARDLQIDAVDPRVGRYKLLTNFLDRQLDAVVDRLPGATPRSLRAGLEPVAAALGPGGSGGLSWAEAREFLGGDEVVNSAVDVGLLVTVGSRVRLAYDQIADVIRPICRVPASVFQELVDLQRVESGPLYEACADLLRLEADGDEKAFLLGFEALLMAMDEFAEDEKKTSPSFQDVLFPLLQGAVSVAQALPRARVDAIERIYRATMKYRTRFTRFLFPDIETLGRWLAEAPLSAALRARLVIEITPWDDAWPWRHKDWSDRERRASFVAALEKPDSCRPGAVLKRLLEEDPTSVLEILVAALTDKRKIEYGSGSDSRGEATVESLCSGILFCCREENPEKLYDLLLSGENDSAAFLLGELALVDSVTAAAKALDRLHGMRSVPLAAHVIVTMWRLLDSPHRAEAVSALERVMAHGDRSQATAAAKAIRQVDATHVTSWDWLMKHVQSEAYGYWAGYLSPIPRARLAAALEIAEANPGFGLDLMRSHTGPAAEQKAMSDVARNLFQTAATDSGRFGALAEVKMNALRDDSQYAPWTEFIEQVAREGDDNARVYLIHSAFTWYQPHAMLERVRGIILESTLQRTEARLIAKKLCASVPAGWRELWIRARRSQPGIVDYHTLGALSRERRLASQEGRGMAAGVLEHWRGLPDAELSSSSRVAIEAAAGGTQVEDIFSREFFELAVSVLDEE